MTVDEISKLLLTLIALYKQIIGMSTPSQVLPTNFYAFTTTIKGSTNELTLNELANHLKGEIAEAQAIIEKDIELDLPF